MSLISRVFFGSLFLIILPGIAAAECDGTQAEMNRCADQQYREQDRRLNELYKRLEKTPELINAQRAWIAFRDAECDWQEAEYKEGSMYPMAYSYCLAGVTEDRIKTFENALSNAGN